MRLFLHDTRGDHVIDKAFAERFAADWIESWNARDLDRILAHYSDDFEFSSPFIIRIAGEPSGVLRGKPAIGAYWTKALAGNASLHFTLDTVLWGINSLVIHYHRQHDGRVASEWFEFGADGKVLRSAAHYNG